jgi:hypothetical protein
LERQTEGRVIQAWLAFGMEACHLCGARASRALFFDLRKERQMRIFESCLLDFVKQQEQMHGNEKTNELKS